MDLCPKIIYILISLKRIDLFFGTVRMVSPPNEILFAYQKQSNRDYIYLGGSEGLVKINTDIPYTETQIPEIYLSEILFNGSPSLKKVKENTIKIPWNYNSLSVHFRIKNRDVFQKYLLQYTIEGRGKQSIETYDPVLNLSSLSAGNYSIWVSCNTKNGNRTPSKQLIHIIVTLLGIKQFGLLV